MNTSTLKTTNFLVETRIFQHFPTPKMARSNFTSNFWYSHPMASLYDPMMRLADQKVRQRPPFPGVPVDPASAGSRRLTASWENDGKWPIYRGFSWDLFHGFS